MCIVNILYFLYILNDVILDGRVKLVGFQVTLFYQLEYNLFALYTELLDEEEFGEASADFNETQINPASKLGLTVGILNSARD